MGWLSGVLSGYGDRVGEIRRDEMIRAEQAAQREAEVYKLLLDSPNEEIRGMAATGLLQTGQPRSRKSGFAGWMGQMESSPIYPTLMKYIRTPQEVPGEPPAPRAPSTYLPPTPGAEAAPPLAQPATSPTEGGQMATPQPMSRLPQPRPMEPPPPPPALAQTEQPIETPVPPPSLAAITPEEEAAAVAVPPAAAPPAMTGPPPAPPGVSPGAAPGAAPAGPPQAAAQPTPPAPPTYRLPQVFATQSDRLAAGERAKVQGEIAGLQEAFKQQGDPDWQKKGIDAYMAQHARATAAAKPITVEYIGPDGQVTQDFGIFANGRYLAQDGTPLPPEARPVTKAPTGTVNAREVLAMKMFGKDGEHPKSVLGRLSAKQSGQLLEAERSEKAITAAELLMNRARVLADAPLSRQAANSLIEELNTKWTKLQEPQRKMAMALNEMEVGVKRLGEDPIGASQAVLITFQKILDPDSVVREGEYARSATGLPLVSRIQGMYDRYIGQWDPQQQRWIGGGAGVPLAELKAMAETARQFLAGMANFNDDERSRINNMAARNGVDPALIFGGDVKPVAPPAPGTTPAPSASATTTPAAGTGTGAAGVGAAAAPPANHKMIGGVLHVETPTGWKPV